jgi:cytosine/adenosine deaminase-related metal-dependent hydrolase
MSFVGCGRSRNCGYCDAVSPRISGLGEQEIDIQGNLVSPPFVESHIHLDSALTAGNRDGIKAVLCSREFKFGVNASKV